MRNLTTVSEKLSDHMVRVFWRSGDGKNPDGKGNGILDVNLNFKTSNQEVAGELIAINHLVYEKKVTGSPSLSGKNMNLTVSCGAIKKLYKKKSDKRDMFGFAKFMIFRMQGVNLKIGKSMLNMPDVREKEPVVLNANYSDYSMHNEIIETPAMGRIEITQHAVDRYEERSGGFANSAFESLAGRLMHAELRRLELTDRVLRQKCIKHGKAGNVEAWNHPDSQVVYLCIVENGRRIVVTVFKKKFHYEKRYII